MFNPNQPEKTEKPAYERGDTAGQVLGFLKLAAGGAVGAIAGVALAETFQPDQLSEVTQTARIAAAEALYFVSSALAGGAFGAGITWVFVGDRGPGEAPPSDGRMQFIPGAQELYEQNDSDWVSKGGTRN